MHKLDMDRQHTDGAGVLVEGEEEDKSELQCNLPVWEGHMDRQEEEDMLHDSVPHHMRIEEVQHSQVGIVGYRSRAPRVDALVALVSWPLRRLFLLGVFVAGDTHQFVAVALMKESLTYFCLLSETKDSLPFY
jgi:hypothetical protein